MCASVLLLALSLLVLVIVRRIDILLLISWSLVLRRVVSAGVAPFTLIFATLLRLLDLFHLFLDGALSDRRIFNHPPDDGWVILDDFFDEFASDGPLSNLLDDSGSGLCFTPSPESFVPFAIMLDQADRLGGSCHRDGILVIAEVTMFSHVVYFAEVSLSYEHFVLVVRSDSLSVHSALLVELSLLLLTTEGLLVVFGFTLSRLPLQLDLMNTIFGFFGLDLE